MNRTPEAIQIEMMFISYVREYEQTEHTNAASSKYNYHHSCALEKVLKQVFGYTEQDIIRLSNCE